MRILAPMVLAILFIYHGASGEEEKRIATMVDSSGVSSEVTDLYFSGKMQRFHNAYKHIGLYEGPFELAIPLEGLVSIGVTENIHTVNYLFRGKGVMAKGKLFPGEIKGESDFGEIKLSMAKLKSLVFNGPPKAIQRDFTPHNFGALVLSNGARVNMDSLMRHDSYYSSEGYIVGGSTRYVHFRDIRFLRGESLLTVGFEKIKRIEFLNETEVSVTLHNGKKAAGKLSDKPGAKVVGFTGKSDKGKFYIEKKHVKSIEFVEFLKTMPQAEPIIALINAVITNDQGPLKTAFSKELHSSCEMKGWDEILKSYQEGLKLVFGEYKLEDFRFAFIGDGSSGSVRITCKGKEAPALMVIKEGAHWKLKER